MVFDDEILRAKIMVKEYIDRALGSRVYLVNAVEIENAGVVGEDPGVSGQSRREDNSASSPPPGVSSNFTQLVKAVKGENVSKVVDENGEPLVVYHGMPDSREFNKRPIFDGTDTEEYVQDEEKEKEIRAQIEEEVKNPNYLEGERYFALLDQIRDLKKTKKELRPTFLTDKKQIAQTYADDTRSYDYQNAEPEIKEAFLKIISPETTDAKGRSWGEKGGYTAQYEQIKNARKNGRDGLIINNTRDAYENRKNTPAHKVFVTFDSPTQIKSATDNVGTFDPENPSILYQEDEAFNDKLDAFQEGNLDPGEVIKIGEPRGVLRGFIPNLPIYIRQSVLKKVREKHRISFVAIRDLPGKLADPVFVFMSKDENARLALIDSKDEEGRNLLVAIRYARTIHEKGSVLEINDISSIYGKNENPLILWIAEDGLLLYADKNKGRDWVDKHTGSHSRRLFDINHDLLKEVYARIEEKSNLPPEGLLFQTEEELADEARSFETPEEFQADVEEYLRFSESVGMAEDSPVPDLPPAEKALWYREFWERARNAEKPADKAARLDGEFGERIRDPGGLAEFLTAIYDEALGGRTDETPSDAEEAAAFEERASRAARIERSVHPLIYASAIRVGRHGKELSPKTARAIRTIMTNAAPEYRALYAELLRDPRFAEAERTIAREERKAERIDSRRRFTREALDSARREAFLGEKSVRAEATDVLLFPAHAGMNHIRGFESFQGNAVPHEEVEGTF